MTDTATWRGREFKVYDHAGEWNDVGGVYIFAGIDSRQNLWLAKYVGKTESFKDRIPNHEQWSAAKRAGATHVHARTVTDDAARTSLEADLIETCQPPLNTQLK